jgi:hypothetical protein
MIRGVMGRMMLVRMLMLMLLIEGVQKEMFCVIVFIHCGCINYIRYCRRVIRQRHNWNHCYNNLIVMLWCVLVLLPSSFGLIMQRVPDDSLICESYYAQSLLHKVRKKEIVILLSLFCNNTTRKFYSQIRKLA